MKYNTNPNPNINVNPNEARSALDELKKKMQLSKQMNQQSQQSTINKQPMAMKSNNLNPNNYGNTGGGYSNNSGSSTGGSGFSNPKSGSSKLYAQPIYGEQVDELPRSPCTICGRMFVLESLGKHTKICQKNATKKRRKFDMKKKRLVDGDQASLQKYGEMERKKLEAKKQMQKGVVPKWKKQSEEFRRVLKENRNIEGRK